MAKITIETGKERITLQGNTVDINAILKGIKSLAEILKVSVVVEHNAQRVRNWRFIMPSLSYIDVRDTLFMRLAKVYGELDGVTINSQIVEVEDNITHVVVKTFTGSLYALYPEDVYAIYNEAYPDAYYNLTFTA
jgi:hypothetical protein